MKQLLLISALMIYFLAFSISPDKGSWTLHKETEGVRIYSKTVQCDKQTYRVFKYENTSEHAKQLSWRLDVYTNGMCRSCMLPSPNEYEQQIKIDASETIVGDCASKEKALRLFWQDRKEHLAAPDSFVFSNLNIVTLNTL